MAKSNPFLPPQQVVGSGGETPGEPETMSNATPLVNENDKEKIDGDPGQIIDTLRAEIQVLEDKNDKVTAKNEKLKADLEEANRRAGAHAIKAQRMRVFCEIINGIAARGDFKPFHATTNPNGIKDNATIDAIINHAAGVAERAVKIVDERFAK